MRAAVWVVILVFVGACSTSRRTTRDTGRLDSAVLFDAQADSSITTSSGGCQPLADGPTAVGPGEFWDTYDGFSLERTLLDCGAKPDGTYIVEAIDYWDDPNCSDPRFSIEIDPYSVDSKEYFGTWSEGVRVTWDSSNCVDGPSANTTANCNVCIADELSTLYCPVWYFSDGSGPTSIKYSWRCR